MKRYIGILVVLCSFYLTGCATVPMASIENDAIRKSYSKPFDNSAGLYIYRDTKLGGALKKTVSIDGEVIGETAPMTYFYRNITPGSHIISTESEFSDNMLTLDAIDGKNHFVRQYQQCPVSFLHALKKLKNMKFVLDKR